MVAFAPPPLSIASPRSLLLPSQIESGPPQLALPSSTSPRSSAAAIVRPALPVSPRSLPGVHSRSSPGTVGKAASGNGKGNHNGNGSTENGPIPVPRRPAALYAVPHLPPGFVAIARGLQQQQHHEEALHYDPVDAASKGGGSANASEDPDAAMISRVDGRGDKHLDIPSLQLTARHVARPGAQKLDVIRRTSRTQKGIQALIDAMKAEDQREAGQGETTDATASVFAATAEPSDSATEAPSKPFGVFPALATAAAEGDLALHPHPAPSDAPLRLPHLPSSARQHREQGASTERSSSRPSPPQQGHPSHQPRPLRHRRANTSTSLSSISQRPQPSSLVSPPPSAADLALNLSGLPIPIAGTQSERSSRTSRTQQRLALLRARKSAAGRKSGAETAPGSPLALVSSKAPVATAPSTSRLSLARQWLQGLSRRATEPG